MQMASIDDEDKIYKKVDDHKVMEMDSESNQQIAENKIIENDEVGGLSYSLIVEKSCTEKDQSNSIVESKEVLEPGSRVQSFLEEMNKQIRDKAVRHIDNFKQIKSIRIEKERRMNDEIGVEYKNQIENQGKWQDLIGEIQQEKCIVIIGEIIDIWDKYIVEKIDGQTKIIIETQLQVEQNEQFISYERLYETTKESRQLDSSEEPKETIIREEQTEEVLVSEEPKETIIREEQTEEVLVSEEPKETIIREEQTEEVLVSEEPKETIIREEQTEEVLVSEEPKETIIREEQTEEVLVSEEPKETIIREEQTEEVLVSEEPKETIIREEQTEEVLVSEEPKETIIREEQTEEVLVSEEPKETIIREEQTEEVLVSEEPKETIIREEQTEEVLVSEEPKETIIREEQTEEVLVSEEPKETIIREEQTEEVLVSEEPKETIIREEQTEEVLVSEEPKETIIREEQTEEVLVSEEPKETIIREEQTEEVLVSEEPKETIIREEQTEEVLVSEEPKETIIREEQTEEVLVSEEPKETIIREEQTEEVLVSEEPKETIIREEQTEEVLVSEEPKETIIREEQTEEVLVSEEPKETIIREEQTEEVLVSEEPKETIIREEQTEEVLVSEEPKETIIREEQTEEVLVSEEPKETIIREEQTEEVLVSEEPKETIIREEQTEEVLVSEEPKETIIREEQTEEVLVSEEPKETIIREEQTEEVLVSEEPKETIIREEQTEEDFLHRHQTSQLPFQHQIFQLASPLLIPSPTKFSSNLSSIYPDSSLPFQLLTSSQHQQASLPLSKTPQILPESQPQPSSDYHPKKSLIQMLYFQQQPTISILNEPEFNPFIVVSQPQDNMPEISSSQHVQKVCQQQSESLYPQLNNPVFQAEVVLPNQSTPLSASFNKLSSPTRNKQADKPITTSTFDIQHSSTPLTIISFLADKPISSVSQTAPEFQQEFMEEYHRYTASKETVNPSPPLSPFSPRTQSIYQQNFINNLPYYHNNQYQETISPPLEHFPEAEYIDSYPSEVQAPPQPVQINLYHPSSPIAPPVIDKEPQRTLKTDDSSIRKSFERINFPTTHCRIVGNHRYVDSLADKTDQNQAQQLLATLKELNIPKKSQKVERVQSLDVEQVHSQRKLLNNLKLFNAPQNKIDSIIINSSKPAKKQQLSKPIPFQQQLKFNIQRQFPVTTQSHLKYLSQNQYNYNQSITSNYPPNNYSYQESSDYNIPSPNWLYKESLKVTPRMNFSYAYPKVSLETPLYNNSYENGNSVFLREEKEVAPVSGGRNIKISLCSPKAPKMRSNEGKTKRNFIKLRSPHHKGDVFHSRQKRMFPAFEPNSEFRSNQANSYQINSGASPRKKKLKLVQKTKSPFTQIPASAVPQKQISLFEQDNPKVIRASNQLHREKIKITLKTNPPKPMEIQSQERVLADQSQILVEYQENQRPIYARIH